MHQLVLPGCYFSPFLSPPFWILALNGYIYFSATQLRRKKVYICRLWSTTIPLNAISFLTLFQAQYPKFSLCWRRTEYNILSRATVNSVVVQSSLRKERFAVFGLDSTPFLQPTWHLFPSHFSPAIYLAACMLFSLSLSQSSSKSNGHELFRPDRYLAPSS
jgi:hypothetical protein